MNDLLKIDPAFEKERIVNFLRKTLKEQNKETVALGMSGGIDSMTGFYLLKEAVNPENILIAYLPYFESKLKHFKNILKKVGVPNKNIHELSIKSTTDGIKKMLNLSNKDQLRLGNIMARVRMVILYDFAKKNNALVLGTEDKSEFLLGYFTKFGDQASDIEPIRHLYKTQVHQLAEYLGVPEEIVKQKSSPELWLGQTAEKELGFSYKEADTVLYSYFDKKVRVEEIKKMNFPNAEKIIDYVNRNSFKHRPPYTP